METFKLLDFDASRIPRNGYGVVRPGNSIELQPFFGHWTPPHTIKERGLSGGFTKHIEADWDDDFKRMNICTRYKGCRLGNLKPCVAD